MTDLRAVLAAAADDLVPEHDPLGGDLDGVRRLVRRRRSVRRVQASAGALVGVAAIGTASMLLGEAPPPAPAGPAAECGESFLDALPADGELGGFATIQTADGMSVSMRTQLENLGDVDLVTVGEVQLLVSLPGTGRVVGYAAAAPSEQVRVAAGTSGDLFTTSTLVSCGFAGTAAGDPLPDGTYDLTLTGRVTAGGAESGWTATTNGIAVVAGQVSDAEVSAGFAPVCGEMIPAVDEFPMWAATAAAGGGPFQAADPDLPYTDGLSLDLTIGTTSLVGLSGEVSPEVVTVLTDLDGYVITWWRASEHGRPLDLGPGLELAAEGTAVLEGFAWFPVVDTCGGAPRTIPDGDYRLFTWTEVTVRAEGSDAVERYPMVSVPLDVTVTEGSMTAG